MTGHPTSFPAVFRAHIANPASRNRVAVECADEKWTYDDLDVISTGLALEIAQKYGSRPTVATISENLPYTFALSIAVWKLGGILAPIDYHTPETLLRPMLQNIIPACVVVPSIEQATQNIVLDAGWPVLSFAPEESTMEALCQRFTEALDLAPDESLLVDPNSVAIYLFTSSASDVTNIKCVPLTHRTLITQAHSVLAWNRRTFPQTSFDHLRNLGFAPFSHMLAVLDIGWNWYLTAGCYIFGLTPSGYLAQREEASSDMATHLLQSIEKFRPDTFGAVPWIFESIMKLVLAEPDAERQTKLNSVLAGFKMVTLGGAPTSEKCVRWTQSVGIPLSLQMGMTELGGSLFHRVADLVDNGWPVSQRLTEDAEFALVDVDGNPHPSEGELWISSRVIATGYLRHDSSPFSIGPDGLITFKTGDRYRLTDGRLKWLGRMTDFIILGSGEMVDPRILERSLDECPPIARTCIIGNNFLRTAEFLCALVELKPGEKRGDASTNMEVSRAIREVNRQLAPPLRIKWTRVFILEEGQSIPINTKKQIFRKKLEALFGRLVNPNNAHVSDTGPTESVADQALFNVVAQVVATGLGVPPETLLLDEQSTFAEFGMDSASSVSIVSNLNERLGLKLPRNTCHTYVDLKSLTAFISERLGQADVVPALQKAPKVDNSSSADDVVIVGQAMRLPGDISTPESFWEALVDMREDLMIPMPSDRWDHSTFYKPYDETGSDAGYITFKKAGFIEVGSFDNAFFGISAAEAFFVAPAVRISLETAFQALENANIASASLKGTRTGVFAAGGMDVGYSHLMFSAMGFDSYSRFHGTGTANSTICGRLSYLLDVHGPSTIVDTACSGGMVAFDQAVQYLRSGQAETAIVLGTNTHTWFTSAQKMTSPHSRCATFASDADGYVPSEAAVAFVLKTKQAALRDGDTILAVVKAAGTTHNGKSQGLAAPSATGQADLQRSLLSAASMAPSDIDFFETHGTGTSLGDLIEIEGINSVFAGSHTPERPLIIGASKTVYGHTEVTAGLVGILKAIKQLETGHVTGLNSIVDGKLNPELDLTTVPLLIPSDTAHLKRSEMPLRGLVVAYGFAGTLSGTILEAPPRPKAISGVAEPSWMLFAVSAKTLEALNQQLRQYLEFCSNAPPDQFGSICYTSCIGRDMYRYRFSCVAKDMDGLVQRLQGALSQISAAPSPNSNARLVLAFPGQGSQYFGMASALSRKFQDFKVILKDAAKMATSLAGFDVLSLLLGQGQDEIDKSDVAQICIFVYQYAVSQFLRKLGVKSHAVIGNSLGEISAAVQAGALSYELGLRFVVARAKILAADPARPAGMLAIAGNQATILGHIRDLHLEERVVIAVFSSKDSHVVSGDLEAIHTLLSHVKRAGTRATLLNVDQGFHSHSIDGRLQDLATWLSENAQSARPLALPIFSTALGRQLAVKEVIPPQYWVDHARNPVRFAQAAAKIKEDKLFKRAIILDVGPTPTAWAALQSNDLSDNLLLSSSAKKGKDQELAFLSAIASLIECGVNPDVAALFGPGIPKTNLPSYPFQRQRFYPDVIPTRSLLYPTGSSTGGTVTPLTSEDEISASPPSTFVVDPSLFEVLNDHRIQGEVVLPGAGMVDAFARVRAKESLNIRFHRPWVLSAPGQISNMEFGADSAFTLYDDNKGDKLCTGTYSAATPHTAALAGLTEGLPTNSRTWDDVYVDFVNVQFGPLFKSITSVLVWDKYAEGHITVKPSSNPENDRIRALDACLHMFGTFGAFATNMDSELSFQSGAFLPWSLEGYTMCMDALPETFVCRYRLPISRERGGRVVSTAFEVFSLSGKLLAYCAKYSVAWIDMSASQAQDQSVFQQVWIPKALGPASSSDQGSRIIFSKSRSDWTTACSPDSVFVDLEDFASIDIKPQSTIILDAMADDKPESELFSAFWQKMLFLMKSLGRQKTGTFTLVVVSASSSTEPSVLGPMAQGMLRVFRRELGTDKAYGIEVPADASPKDIARIVESELGATRGAVKDNIVSYRSPSLLRFVPQLQPLLLDEASSVVPSGVAVIVGMGSIGFALSSHMIAAGFSSVVFIGRRPSTDAKVSKQLSTVASAQVGYLQADVSNRDSLRTALRRIIVEYGSIKSIIHTAASVHDMTIASITVDAFDTVIRPKVHGAYNLHLLAEELGLELHSFVLLSSISVPLGNPGQVAYVAANSFLDSLAAFRQSRGLPGVSLQLGPWESELMDNLATQASNDGAVPVMTMAHKDGLPLIIRSLASPVPVQLIASVNPQALSRIPAFATDSLFSVLFTDTADKPSGQELNPHIYPYRVLELSDSEPLELNDSMTATGIDSIAFGQIRGAVLKQLGVDIPLVYLSDAFTLNDMLAYVQESAGGH
ncbi:hypothetical protein FB45DRAFT_909481 [Roridomyces roridus]|uniref:Polyketide synthase n=1 Tax=Roridomyces roridus TaxID=1738132 RepID=A0AAD7BYZ4_9AGAR|nr:hypothetical protein FB45DRAFT_909481 [Roridomyces roridus]